MVSKVVSYIHIILDTVLELHFFVEIHLWANCFDCKKIILITLLKSVRIHFAPGKIGVTLELLD